jgi:hypothetical protein
MTLVSGNSGSLARGPQSFDIHEEAHPALEPSLTSTKDSSAAAKSQKPLSEIVHAALGKLSVVTTRAAQSLSSKSRIVQLRGPHAHTPLAIKILKTIGHAIGNFFVALWSSLTLALTREDQNWRKYEKYHFLADQTLQGLDTTLASLEPSLERPKGLYTKETRETVGAWVREARLGTPIADLPKKARTDTGLGKFHLQKAIACLQQAQSATTRAVDCRDLHKAFLSHLREAMETKAYTKKGAPSAEQACIKALANELCYAMYTQANMTGFSQSLVAHVLGEPKEATTAFDASGTEVGTPTASDTPTSSTASEEEFDFDLTEAPEPFPSPLEIKLGSIEGMYRQIRESSDSKKINPATKVGQSIRGELRGLGFDPHMQGNPPYRKFDVHTRSGRVVSNLRISTPTKGAEINPEFKGYLKALAERGERHMYINLQRAHGGNAGENQRSEAIHALSRDPEFAPALSVVTLDKNTSFYAQKDDFKNLGATAFKDLFCERLLSPDSGFYIPESIGTFSKADIQIQVRNILDGLHTHFFEGKEDLSVEERHNMIELAYTMMISRFVEMSGARYYNNSCKDCIDRGGGANALMAYLLTAIQEREAIEADLALLPAMTYSDAIWARKREIIHERLDRALGGAEALLGASDEAKAWLRDQMAFISIEHLPILDQPIQP